MDKINNGFMDYYLITVDGAVYNEKTDKFLKEQKGSYYLKTTDGKFKWISKRKLLVLLYGVMAAVEDHIELLPGEVFKEISGTDQRYFISNKGRVKSLSQTTAKILKPVLLEGYPRVQIKINGVWEDKFVHTLVAEAFLMPPIGRNIQIHHIDGNRQNCCAENLIYLTVQQHVKLHKGELSLYDITSTLPKSEGDQSTQSTVQQQEHRGILCKDQSICA